MKRAILFFSCRAGGMTYPAPAWWAVGEDDEEGERGYIIAGPASSRQAVCRELADRNRLVRSGAYSPRPLYTGYCG